MNKKIRPQIYIIGGSFLFLDQLLKYFARVNPEVNYIWKGIAGWGYFANHGVAFNIPLPIYITAFITPIIIIGFIFFLLKNKNAGRHSRLAAALIIAGALSNFADRIIFNVTIDYLHFFTSVINLADVMIIVGVLLLLIQNSKSIIPRSTF